MPFSNKKIIRRQWELLMFLSKEWGTFHKVSDLAKMFKVSKATMQRDLEILDEVFGLKTKKDPKHDQRLMYRIGIIITISK